MREIFLSYQKNVRDLGSLSSTNGKKVKIGHIFRGGHLHRVSEEDIKMINSLHLTDIVDFRGEKEFLDHHDYDFESVEIHNFPAMVEEVKKGKQKYEDGNLLWFLGELEGYQHMLHIYKDIVTTEVGINAYKNYFKVLAQPNKRVYFHCSQGKDRAGMAAYLTLIALGVDEKVAREDYLLSNVAMEIKIAELKEMLGEEEYFDEEYERSLRDVFSVYDAYLNSALDAIKKENGTVLNFIKNKLEVDIDYLRELYLE